MLPLAILTAKPGVAAPAAVERETKQTRKTRYGGLAIVPPIPSSSTIRSGRFALFFTGAGWLAYMVEQAIRLHQVNPAPRTYLETVVYIALVTLLTLSSSAYLLARIGYFERIRSHRRVARSVIDEHFEDSAPSLTIIIPSYREDARVIQQTLLSAALQEYPNLRVVLLLDDPPNPSDPEHRRVLERGRALPGIVADALRKPRQRFAAALKDVEEQELDNRIAHSATLYSLAEHYEEAARWFDNEKENLSRVDHSDEFLALELFDRMAADLRITAVAIRSVAAEKTGTISMRRVHQLYMRLERIFNADLHVFERKQYASLSHESNKAMNLNSYLGLMGGDYCIVSSPGGRVLVPAQGRAPDVVIPDTDFVLTLDADSILLPEYCLRLVYHMDQPENADVAVAQTPYSAYRGAPHYIERIAGATTDIQHIVHQGLTAHDATFWVGANAVIRKRALDELVVEEAEDGFTIRRYIKDRTVIEDTESSIDLRARGWRLYNYPERLSYSATPSDFGSLVIQRQRWANGGLLILPSLLRLLRKRRPDVARPKLAELFLRTTYLASISWATLSLVLLLFYPFDERLLTQFALVTALPYFWTMANDLQRAGYRRWDIFAVYGFNLLLLPVNLAGTLQSIMQAIGGHKIPFARTPKVKNRTVAPTIFVAVPVLLIVWSIHTLLRDVTEANYYHGIFAGTNLLMTVFACVALYGLGGMAIDLMANIRQFVMKEPKVKTEEERVPYWASVLYVGSSIPEEISKGGPMAVALAAQDRFQAEGVPLQCPASEKPSPGKSLQLAAVSEMEAGG